jgi:site-specific DNA-methyltransferase (adenine-specific)
MKTIKLSNLILDPNNANKGTQRGKGLLEKSLQELGAGRSILVDKHGIAIAGNKTLETAVESGFEDAIVVETDGSQLVVVKRTDLDLNKDEKAKRLAIADNRVGELSLNWDAEVLAELAEEVDLTGFFEGDELAALLSELDQELPDALQEEDEEAVSDLINEAESGQLEPRVKLGEIWQLGKHRLACGDSTDEGNVRKLLAARLADCCWTDPPYGVSYVGKTKDALTIDNDGAKDLPKFIKQAFQAIDAALKPGGAIYIAHPDGALHLVFGNAFVEQGWRLHETLIWVKNSMVLGHSDYHFKHEPIYFGYKPGGGRRGRGGEGWYGDNSQVTVFEVDKPSRNSEHPTMKPVELIQPMLLNSCPPKGLVFEPFSGSGSTLMAAQSIQGDRTVYGFELSEAYCTVILERWERFTGKVAALAGHL